jgi:hypothetical protein
MTPRLPSSMATEEKVSKRKLQWSRKALIPLPLQKDQIIGAIGRGEDAKSKDSG